MIRVTVDNQVVEVTEGSNLLAAVRKAGHDIPALCYHPACEPNTSCMACVVRLADSGRIVPACATPAEDGLVVESETSAIHELRRTALELLLSDHALDEAGGPGYPECACETRETCRLRKYARMYDADPQRFRGLRRELDRTAPRYRHSEITYDPAKCILCGICIQLTQQAGERPGLTLIGRGFEMRVDVPLDGRLADAVRLSARRVAGACPTDALRRRRADDPAT